MSIVMNSYKDRCYNVVDKLNKPSFYGWQFFWHNIHTNE